MARLGLIQFDILWENAAGNAARVRDLVRQAIRTMDAADASFDLLLLPEAEGVTRSLVLDAMSTGMAVVTAEDRDVPALCDHTIARICSPEATEWAGAIESLLENRAEQRSLGTAARAYVSENHRPSKYISSLVDAYEWLVGNDSIPIASKES